MNAKLVIPAIGAGIVVVSIVLLINSSTNNVAPSSSTELASDNIPYQISDVDESNSSNTEIMITNGQKHLVPLDKIRGGGPPKDGIPSIDDPNFVSAQDAQFVSDSDIVIGLEINGDARAYPLFIMVWHEM